MLDLQDVIEFGKYKGKGHTVEFLLKNDPGYLVWLRNQKLIDGGRDVAKDAFSKDIHIALNAAIAGDKSLARKFSKFDLDAPSAVSAGVTDDPGEKISLEERARALAGGKKSVSSDVSRGTIQPAEPAYAEWGEF